MATTKDVIRIGERTWTQAEWNRMLAEADRASAEEARRWPQVTAVSYDRATQRIVLELNNGVQLAVAADRLQGVAGATEEQRAAVSILGPNRAIQFRQIDEQFTVAGLLNGVFGTRAWMSKLAVRKKRSLASVKSVTARTKGAKVARQRKSITA